MRKKYFDREYVFAFMWQHADHDGIWDGDAATLAEEFRVSEDAAHSTLGDLCDRGLIQSLGTAKYIIVNWREKDDPSAEEEL
jgi:hypothetical protein